MKKIFPLLLLPFLLSACGQSEILDLQKPLPNKLLLEIDAPASGLSWKKKSINCKNKTDGICADASLLLEQRDFPKRAQTEVNTLASDYENLQARAKFSGDIATTQYYTSLPPNRTDTYSFSADGQELTVVISGSVAEVRNTLLSPSGRVILPDGGSDHEKTPYLERFVVANPQRGKWTLRSQNVSIEKPVYALTFETFTSPYAAEEKGVEIKAQVLDDGEVVLSANNPRASGEYIYEWNMGDGWSGQGVNIGHNYKPGLYSPSLLLIRKGAASSFRPAPFLVRKQKGELPEIIEVNEKREKLPSGPKLVSGKREGDFLRVGALAGSSNGGPPISAYQYSLDGGAQWQRIELLDGYFTIPYPTEGARLVFRALNRRGVGGKSIVLCNFSGFYPLEARARGSIDNERVNIYISSGGCPGERWNIIAPLWKRAGIF